MKLVANLFLHPEKIKHNGKDSREEVERKLRVLVNDMAEIRCQDSDENLFFIARELPCTKIYQKTILIDFAEESLQNEEKGLFYSILGNTSFSSDDISIDELMKKCRFSETETEVNSIIVLNEPMQNEEINSDANEKKPEKEEKVTHRTIINDYITFENYEVIYNKRSWIHLRRQILGNHPGSPDEFISECRKYFSNLTIHDNCIASLKDNDFEYLEIIPRKIVYYLSCLNDIFPKLIKSYKVGSDPNIILADFSGTYCLDKAGSLQQNPDKKPNLTFEFIKKSDKSACRVLCEPHLKIEIEDSNCKKSIDHRIFHPRIYFCYTSPEIDNGNILVGSIGKHI